MRVAPIRIPRRLVAALLVALATTTTARADLVLSDNLSATPAGTATASGDSWLASSFGTGSSPLSLSTVTLMIQADAPGAAAEVDLYSDALNVPDSPLATLSQTGTLGTTPGAVDFSGDGLNLAAGSTYWVVLKATAGAVDWAYTLDNSGAGIGFQHTQASTDDAGQTWFAYDVYPQVMRVSAVPEPASIALVATGAAGLLIRARRGRRAVA